MKILWWLFMCPTLHIVAQNMHTNMTEIHVLILDTAVINCRLSSNVAAYRWLRNGNVIATRSNLNPAFTNSRFQITADKVKGFYNFTILNVTHEDLGEYICETQVSNSINISTSYYTLKLTVMANFAQGTVNPCSYKFLSNLSEDLCMLSVECARGRFGQYCQFQCNCLNGSGCNPVDGLCPHKHCAAGWELSNCSKECAHGRFGQNCQFKCKCLNGTGCSPINGNCTLGHAGWELNNCSIVSHQESVKGVSFEVFGICVSAVIILAFLTVMIVCCYFRRKINQSSRIYEDIRLNAGQRRNEDPVYSELGQVSC